MTTVKYPVQPKPKSLVRREPAVTVGVITAIVAAAFGVAPPPSGCTCPTIR